MIKVKQTHIYYMGSDSLLMKFHFPAPTENTVSNENTDRTLFLKSHSECNFFLYHFYDLTTSVELGLLSYLNVRKQQATSTEFAGN